MLSFISIATALAVGITAVQAESHTITQINNCGSGTPVISQNFVHVADPYSYTATSTFSAIAWLDQGNCDFEAVNCGMVEFTLLNGGTSSADISLISPHTYTTPISWVYTGGCAGVGAACDSADCPNTDAFHVSTDYSAQRQCESDDSGLTITYC